jgi:hypothetical protein
MKRLVLFVEGEGDFVAVPSLISRVQLELPAHLQGHLFLDGDPIRAGGVHNITGKRSKNLINWLKVANKRGNLGTVLIVLDGDAEKVEGTAFCGFRVARMLADRAREAGAGVVFSIGVVFLQPEFESILISVAKQLSDIRPDTILPANIEESPRDAKGWLNDNLKEGYRSTSDQARLTRQVTNWTPAKSLRCFRRLTHALEQLTQAVQSGQHIISPS